MATHLSSAKRGLDAMLEKLICDKCKDRRSWNLQCSCLKTLCRDCAGKSDKCPFCPAKAPTKPNKLMNIMIKMCTKLCENSADGCIVTGNDYFLKEHAVICEYRRIRCPFQDECGKFKISLFPDHLKTNHKGELSTVKNEGAYLKLVIQRADIQTPNAFIAGIPFVMRFDGRSFVAYTIQGNGFLSFNLVMLGPKSAVGDYSGQIFVNPGMPTYKIFGDPLTSAADHCVSPEEHIKEKFYDDAIPVQFLKKYAYKSNYKSIKIEVRIGLKRKSS